MNSSVPVFAVGTRVAGAVVVLGYLVGVAPGAIVSVVGGLALVTFGRALALERTSAAATGAALAVTAGALGVGALRWGTLRLDELAGAQAVLGPTVTVGPEAAAISTGVALAAALVGVGIWLAEPRPAGRAQTLWAVGEAGLAVLTVTVVFAAPGGADAPGVATWISAAVASSAQWAIWAGSFTVGVAIAFGIGWLVRRWSARLRWTLLVASAAAVAAAAAVIANVL